MKKTVVCLVLFICLLFSSCSLPKTYELLNPADEIDEISIVKLTFEDREMVQTKLQKVEDKELFLQEFNEIRCYKKIGDPTGATEEGVENVVFKISYSNGEYELIDWAGQSVYTLKNGLRYYSGFSGFDKAEFESLMNRYSTEKQPA